MEKLAPYWNNIEGLVIQYAGKLILAIIVLIIGWWLINRLANGMSRMMVKKEVDASLRPFLKTITTFTLRVMLILAVAGMVGIEMTSFIAVLGAAGLAVGLALQGSLSNFAGGIIILIMRPFKVGDFITCVGGLSGTVREIRVFYTYLTSGSNQEIVIPNGKLANAEITNYSWHDSRRLDLTFRIGYESDLNQVKNILNELIVKEKGLLTEPAHSIFVEDLADDYLILHLRAWLRADEYWNVSNAFFEKVKERFDQEGIHIPSKKMAVSMKS